MRIFSKTKYSGAPTVDELSLAIARSWARDTSYDPSGWSEQKSAWGQCAVSALVVQDLLGGDLLVGKVNGIEHYWNLLADSREVDLTRHQFGDIKSFQGPTRVEREFVLSFPETRRRYHRLRRKVNTQLRDLSRAIHHGNVATGPA